jgi:hypothetical protein
MVGPSLRMWKVLRETDGERFMAKNKVRDFLRDLRPHKNKFRVQQFNWTLRMFFMRSDILSQQSCLQIKKTLS